MTGIILLGGGLDSTALLLNLRRERQEDLVGMHFQYGQKADKHELDVVRYWCNKLDVPLKVFSLPLNEIAESAILRNSSPNSNKLEGRNVVFTMLAATYATTIGAGKVFLGYHKEPPNAPFPDATRDALQAMAAVVQTAYRIPIAIVAPFAHLSRTDILRIGFRLDEEIITQTHTCYEDVLGGCGQCAHCRQRATMIRNLLTGQDEPLEENH